MRPETIGAAAVAGLATGPRSFTGLAAVVFAAPRDAQAQPDRVLGHPAAKAVIGAIALQEWVLDKLPNTPSRLEVLGLCTRAVGAGAAGAVLARRAQVAEATSAVAPVEPVTPERRPPGEPSTSPPAPDWTAIGACAATSAALALGVAAIGVRLRGGFDKLFGRDWPAAALEDASSAALAAGAVYLAGGYQGMLPSTSK